MFPGRFLFLAIALLITLGSSAQSFHVATYNLRYANGDDSLNGNGWGQRYPVISQLIRFHDFDIFGTQEGLYPMLTDLQDSLSGYSFIGIGRDDGKRAGEHSAIFYKNKKFTLLKQGNFWLSTVTDRPNKGWDAALPRICTWGEFKENSSGFVFYFFNLHMDHIGVKARAESAKLVLERVKEMAGETPTILTGDFNVDQTSESYTLINTSGVLKDAYELSPLRYALNGTFNNFKTDRFTTSRIDHIFVTRQFQVSRYGILTDSYRLNGPREPSDHFPVMAEISH